MHTRESGSEGLETTDFLRLVSIHQARIHAYVRTLLPEWNDVEDVLQETYVALWQSFSEFEPNSNFPAWACKVAYYQVLAFRRRQKRVPELFSEAFLEAVAAEAVQTADAQPDQLRALASCVERLSPKERDLIKRCYQHGAAIKDVAEQLNRPAKTVYKALTRIRRNLFTCIERTLAAEERS